MADRTNTKEGTRADNVIYRVSKHTLTAHC